MRDLPLSPTPPAGKVALAAVPPTVASPAAAPAVPPAAAPAVPPTALPANLGAGDELQTPVRAEGEGDPAQLSFQRASRAGAWGREVQTPAAATDVGHASIDRAMTRQWAGMTGVPNFTLELIDAHPHVEGAAVCCRSDASGAITNAAIAMPVGNGACTVVYLRRDPQSGEYSISARTSPGALRAATEQEREAALHVVAGMEAPPAAEPGLHQELCRQIPPTRTGLLGALEHGCLRLDPQAESAYRQGSTHRD